MRRPSLLIVCLGAMLALATGCAGGTDPPTPPVSNNIPVAVIDVVASAEVGASITATGTKSMDMDGDALSFAWTLEAPSGSSAGLDAEDAEEVSFEADVAGEYTLTLTVNDGTADSVTVSESITVGGEANRAPVANAPVDVTIPVGVDVTLDGTGSSDPDGDELSYTWSIVDAPAESQDMIAGAMEDVAKITPSAPGSYTIALEVSDGELSDSASFTITATPVGGDPVANAGQDAQVEVGIAHRFDGTGSSDPDGDELSYTWTILSAPEGSSSMLADATSATPSIVADVEGEYHIELEVSDGMGTDTDSVELTALVSPNQAPSADAGPDLTVTLGESVTLDGSASSDPDGDALSYTWSIEVDPSAGADMILDISAETTSYSPSVAGTYTIQLLVMDPGGETSVDTIDVEVLEPANTLPVAVAGDDRTVLRGETVTLDGSASSDVEDDAAMLGLAYAWTLNTKPTASAATLVGEDTATPSFEADALGDYILTLTVTDSRGGTHSDTIRITASSIPNSAPMADAGNTQTVLQGALVTLDGSNSMDVEDAMAMLPLTFAWTIDAQPMGGAAMLSDPTSPTPTFTPNVTGTYTFRLRVTDSQGASATDTVDVIVSLQPNSAPVADAGMDRSTAVRSTVTLDGSASSDAEDDASGTALDYSWVIITKPNNSAVMLSGATSAAPQLTPDLAGTYVIELRVTDSRGATDTDTVSVIATNSAPLADAGPDQAASQSSPVLLDGSNSTDLEDSAAGIPLQYQWDVVSQPLGSNITINNDQNAQATFVPMVEGDYIISLTVTDSAGASGADQATISVTPPNTAPTADAGPDREAGNGAPVPLDGSRSSDPEDDASGTPLGYSWVMVNRPVGSTASLVDETSETPSFTPDLAGRYTFDLFVQDSNGFQSTDTVHIDVFDVSGKCLIISEYVEGSSNNKGIELYNRCAQDIDLAPYKICIHANAATNCTNILDLSGALLANQAYTICNGGLSATLPPMVTCQATSAVANFNGDDRLLVFVDQEDDGLYTPGDIAIDAFGELTQQPAPGTWADVTYRRCDLTPYDGAGAFDEGAFERRDQIDDFSEFGLPPAGCNSAPVALAGADQSVFAGAVVQLDGSSSSDVEDDAASIPLDYLWTIDSAPAGSAAMFDDATIAQPMFATDLVGDYVLTLQVVDSQGAASSDSVTITTTNSAPTANAGADQSAGVGDLVTLDGTASSDTEDDALGLMSGYSWAVDMEPAGSNVTISDANTATPTFTPSHAGDYTLALTVTDSQGVTSTDVVVVSVSAVADPATDLYISEYVEGSSNNKAIELYNANTSSDIDLANIYICVVANADTSCSNTLALSGTLPADGVHTICNSSFDATERGRCDTLWGGMSHNGDDRVLVYHDDDGVAGSSAGDTLVDAFGDAATRPSPAPWSEKTLLRTNFNRHIDPAHNPSGDPFDYTVYYATEPQNTFCYLGFKPGEDDCSP